MITGGEESKNEEEPTGIVQKIQPTLHKYNNLSFECNYTYTVLIIKIFQASPWTSNLINSILVPMIFPTQNTSHKNTNSPLTQNYHFALQNRQISIFHILQKLGMLQRYLENQPKMSS